MQASPEEVATFGTGQAVSVAPVPREREEFFGRDAAAAPFAVPGEVLYTADGRAAAVVRSVNVWHDTHDVSAFGSPHASYVRGARHVGMEVDALMFDDRRRR